MENRRMILAIVLSLLVWYLWLYFFKKPIEPERRMPDVTREEPATTPQKRLVDEPKSSAVRPERISEIKISPSKIKKETSIGFVTDRYTVNLSNRGGIINSFKYNGRNIELVVNRNNKFNARGFFDFAIYLSEDEFLRGSNLNEVLWNYRKESENVISFYTNMYINRRPFKIEKVYTFNKEDYYFKIDYRLTNTGSRDAQLPNDYIIVSPSDFLGPDMDFENQYNQLNYIYNLDGDYETTMKGGGFLGGSGSLKRENGNISWAGLMSRYFLLIMINENFSGSGVIFDTRENMPYRNGIYIPVGRIEPGGKILKSFKVYVGEKNKDKLASVDQNIIEASDVNTLIEPIRDFLMWCLIKINLLFGNMGWSLVIFSLLSKIVLLPLTQKSTESMKKMQELAPKINELKEKYKDKPDQMNKEVMKMYKTNKVNPLGGCLPLLLQMPFFFALWSALINSIDLWNSPFILWITDLSMPDTVMQIQGFNLNILPILMTGTSFIQQKLTTPAGGGTGQQQKMMMFMPLIFIFIFWNMPSGLVLYWTLQNVLQILHQVYVNKKSEEDKE